MSRVAPLAGPADRRRGIRRIALIGVVLCLPQLVLAWLVLPGGFWDIMTLVAPFLYAAGILVLAVAATRAWKLRSSRLLPLAFLGVAAVVIAIALLSAWPPDMKQYIDAVAGLAPAERALHLMYLYVLVWAPWQFGVFVVFGAAGSALIRSRSRR